MKQFWDNTVNFWTCNVPNRQLALWLATIWFASTMLAGCVLSPASEQDAENQGTTDITEVDTNVNDIGMSTAELTQELEALRKSHEKLERLSELEGDLMLLFKELSKQPKIDEGPTGYRPELSAETVEPDEYFSSQSQQPLVIAKKPDKKKQKTADNNNKSTKPEVSGSQNTWNNKNLANDVPFNDPQQSTTGSNVKPIPPAVPRPANYVLWLGFFVSEQAALAGSRRLEQKINFAAYGLSINVVNNANTRGQYHGLVLGPFETLQQANSFCSGLSRYGQFCKVQNAM